MAAKGTTGVPTTISEALQTVAQAITGAMLTPDAGPYLGALDAMMKGVISLGQHAHGGPPGAPMGAPPGAGGPPQQMALGGMGGGSMPPGPGAGGFGGAAPNPDAARQAAASLAGG
jgi:hypothetical protein